jgi:predicted dehydrogenase
MNVLIIGAGRMGIRHVNGCISSNIVKAIEIIDISESSLNNAKSSIIPNETKITYSLLSDFYIKHFDIVIIAATASNRLSMCELAIRCNPKRVLIEKPIGQSYDEVVSLSNFIDKSDITFYVNLNMRLYPFISKLKHDLYDLPQFNGEKTISFNGGSLGIGANGIHYLDILFYLFNADGYKINYCEIDKELLQSGRGESFKDFGGRAVIDFTFNNIIVGKSTLLLSAESTVFGGWEIISKHARVRINELENTRVNIYRKPDSQMPMNRYAADYLPPETIKIETPELQELTKEWIIGISKGLDLLPTLKDSLVSHKLMFEWLSQSDKYDKIFPIT